MTDEPMFRMPAGVTRWAVVHDDDPDTVTLTVATTTHETAVMPRCAAVLVRIYHYPGHGSPRSKDYSPPNSTTTTLRCGREAGHDGDHSARPYATVRYSWTEMVEIDE